MVLPSISNGEMLIRATSPDRGNRRSARASTAIVDTHSLSTNSPDERCSMAMPRSSSRCPSWVHHTRYPREATKSVGPSYMPDSSIFVDHSVSDSGATIVENWISLSGKSGKDRTRSTR